MSHKFIRHDDDDWERRGRDQDLGIVGKIFITIALTFLGGVIIYVGTYAVESIIKMYK